MTDTNRMSDADIIQPPSRYVVINGEQIEVPPLSISGSIKIMQLLGEHLAKLPPELLQEGMGNQERGVMILLGLLQEEKIFLLLSIIMRKPVAWVQEHDELKWAIQAVLIALDDLDLPMIMQQVKKMFPAPAANGTGKPVVLREV